MTGAMVLDAVLVIGGILGIGLLGAEIVNGVIELVHWLRRRIH